jgi:hypothetical protein
MAGGARPPARAPAANRNGRGDDMALKLTYAFALKDSALSHERVLDHLNDILKKFLVQTDATKYYIGMTNDIETRRAQHEKKKPEFTLMCVIHGEDPAMASDLKLDDLEALAINRFRSGITNPTTGRRLTCANTVSGMAPKLWLYVLLDMKDVSGVPAESALPYGPRLRA